MHLNDATLAEIVEDLGQNEMYDMLSSEIKEFCDCFEEAMQDKDNQGIKEMLKLKYSKNGDEKLVLEIIENIYKAYDDTDILRVDEDRFGDIVFKPTFNRVMRGIPYTKRDGQFTKLSNS
ncbi:hypothetical protein BDB00DRAFT_784731 [Zychaea mexicana]|uniref:uncharacterized protein n=1 Tax=Zychaea mexicana TaxID=64656 RepID=UPI0022FED5FC|nr:uncharacterized protein BDB00DRAFT_784731 [Zychaea mexicana]KAI9497385.1 hypothetical protein BDB00DRAFT_784731 [Zychaea mexicana]